MLKIKDLPAQINLIFNFFFEPVVDSVPRHRGVDYCEGCR